MKLTVRGRGLDQLRALRDRLANPGPMLDAISEAVADEALDLVIQGFQKQSDPYNDNWAPKKHPDGRAILTGVTSNLRRGWHKSKIGRHRWRIAPAPTAPYAKHLQKGTKNRDGSVRMVARKMIPDGRGMPRDWDEAFNDTVLETMRAHFRGTGIRLQKRAHFR